MITTQMASLPAAIDCLSCGKPAVYEYDDGCLYPLLCKNCGDLGSGNGCIKGAQLAALLHRLADRVERSEEAHTDEDGEQEISDYFWTFVDKVHENINAPRIRELEAEREREW
jgi:hypothetical protein